MSEHGGPWRFANCTSRTNGLVLPPRQLTVMFDFLTHNSFIVVEIGYMIANFFNFLVESTKLDPFS